MNQIKGVGTPIYARPVAVPDPTAAMLPQAGGANIASSYSHKAIRVYDVSLATARTMTELAWRGSLIWLVKVYDSSAGARSTSAEASLTLHDRANDAIPLVQGNMIAGVPFDRVWITNTEQANITATFVVIDDAPGDEVSAI